MWLNVLLAFVGLVSVAYFWMTRKYGSFKAQGIAEAPSYFPFGCKQNYQMLTGQLSFINSTDEIYRQHRHDKLVGYWVFSTPQLLVNDLDLAKLILIKDFDHFIDRRQFPVSEKSEANRMFTMMLTMLKGEKWKTMRNILSPVFTSGKLKTMSNLINKVGDDFVAHLAGVATRKEEFNAKDMMTNYTLDAIATCGFGVEAKSFTEPDSIFREQAMKMVGAGKRANKLRMMKLLFIIAVPQLAKLLNVSFLDEETVIFFRNIIRESMNLRKQSKTRRNDLVDLVLDALSDAKKDVKEVENDQFEKDAAIKPSSTVEIDDSEMETYLVANSLLLFLAGFDTSSTVMAMCMYFLAKNPTIQEKVYEEIEEAIEKAGTESLDYYTVQSLPYLDMFLNETLRMYPLTHLERVCVADYKVPGTNFTIPKGMLVQVPSGAIMMDDRYFSDPLTFDPEHFSPESKASRTPYAFLAFGQGPRNCIGMRFALLQVKIALVRLVANYKVVPTARTPEKAIPDPLSQSGQPRGGVWLSVEARPKMT